VVPVSTIIWALSVVSYTVEFAGWFGAVGDDGDFF
jgi:hypothetical protein